MKNRILLITPLMLAAMCVRADVLELKNGQTLNGKYAGGTAGTVRFETGGNVQVIETGTALALTFTGGGAGAAAPSAAPAATPAAVAPAAVAPAPAAASVTIPAGTTLLVRLVDP